MKIIVICGGNSSEKEISVKSGMAIFSSIKKFYESELVFLATPNSEEEIEICSYPSSGGVQVQEDLTHLAFEVESLEAFEKHIQSLGMEYSDGPHLKENGGGFAFIDAPEGYEIELIEKAPDSSGY